jgi:outer membrane protein assembly factor BamB
MRLQYIVIWLGLALAPVAFAKDDFPVVLTELDGRPGKTLMKAAYGRGGQLGAFYDVDADGNLEFVALERDDKELSLTVLQIDNDRYSLNLNFGRAAAAGLTAINLDDDEQLEYVVAYGERLEGLKRGLVLFAGALVGTFAAVPIASLGGYTVFLAPVLVPGSATDLQTILAVDDDGSILWQRDFPADGTWDETRFQWVVPETDGSGATILVTDDAQKAMLGLSAEDGRTLWTYALQGNDKASKRTYTSLIDRGRMLPVLFSPGRVLVLDPENGKAEYDGELRRRISEFPSWHLFRVDEERRFLAFGEDRGELNMMSLDTGEVSWTHQSDKIIDILPLPSGDGFITVMEKRIAFINGSGEITAEYKAPDKIKAKFPPVYRDINNDGQMEFVFVSGKNILCWELGTDSLRWETKMGGIVGGANPTQLYDAFYDIDGDGWLDIPARKGSGSGRWLSGDTGEILAEVGNGSTTPIVGDWDGNGRLEIFWVKNWYEVSLAH